MQLWGGRFSGETDELMRQFNDSFHFDRRLYKHDIMGSMAYARALARAGLITDQERDTLIGGLETVQAEFDDESFKALPTDEDIHTAVERRLTEIVGPVGGKLHTGRSRNDQVALDIRLWLRDALRQVQADLAQVQAALVEQAEVAVDAILPGYTHLQAAQPIRFSHWLMSYFWMFDRDQQRLADCYRRTNISPLGAGALAGNPFDIDREQIAAELGMASVTQNSLDAVSDRDHIVEFLFAASMLGSHISRLAEDLIIYSGPGYRFVRLDEAYTTGSSLMPQKRNPDSLELARGKSGRLAGNLVSLMTVVKGIPSTYNKDMQEDKEPLFDTADTLRILLPVLGGVIKTMQVNSEAMRAALDDAMLATDLADYLVRKGVPFREAHHLSGQVVRLAEEKQVAMADISLAELQAISGMFEGDVSTVFDFDLSVERRSVVGGTSAQAQHQQINRAKQILASYTG